MLGTIERIRSGAKGMIVGQDGKSYPFDNSQITDQVPTDVQTLVGRNVVFNAHMIRLPQGGKSVTHIKLSDT